MTTYLTKQQDGKTFHYRVTVIDTVVNVVFGQFYKSITKISNLRLRSGPQKLINEKIADGFKVTDFIETKENSYDIYDKAKYHFEGNFPEDLDDFQGFVHTGMYVGWLIDNNLLDEEFLFASQPAMQKFKRRELTGSQFYQRELDGVLLIDELSEIGNKFSFEYFDFDTGQYLNDFETTLRNELPTLYHVEDTWENYEKIKKVIDKRFLNWSRRNV